MAGIQIESFAITLYPLSKLLQILSTYLTMSMIKPTSQMRLKQAVLHTFSWDNINSQPYCCLLLAVWRCRKYCNQMFLI